MRSMQTSSKAGVARVQGEEAIRVSVLVAALAIAGTPLVIAPGITLQYETAPKLALLLVCSALLSLCWRTWWPGVTEIWQDTRGKWFLILLGTDAVFMLLATASSSRPLLSISGSSWRRDGLITQLAILAITLAIAGLVAAAGIRLRSLIWALALVSGIVAAYAVAQDLGVDPLLPREAYMIKYWNGELLRGPATLGHAIYLGSYLATTIPLILGLAAWESRRSLRYLLLGIAGISLAAVILSGSRSALLALAVAAPFLLGLFPRISVRTWVIGAFVTAAVIGAALLPLRSSVALHVDRWRQDFYGGPRLSVWRESLAMTAEKPLSGWGPDTFANEFRRRESARLARLYPDFTHESPHNFLLDGAISQGCSFPVIVLGFALLIFAPFRLQSDRSRYALRAAFASTLASLFFISITICGALMLFVLPGLFVSGTSKRNDVHRTNPPRWLNFPAWGLAALFIVAAVLCLGKDTAYAGLKRAASEHRFEEMASAYRRSLAFAFPTAGDDLWCSREFAGIARELPPALASQAWPLAAEAAAQEERFGDWRADAAYQSALIAIAMNRAEPAAAALQRAIAYAPNWYKPHLLLAQLLRYTGQPAVAKSEAAAALDLSGKERPSVEQTLASLQ